MPTENLQTTFVYYFYNEKFNLIFYNIFWFKNKKLYKRNKYFNKLFILFNKIDYYIV